MFFTSLTAASINKNAKNNPNGDDSKPTVNSGALLFLLAVFLIELALFVWAMILAVRCGKRHKDLFIHLIFAFFFPFFYILYYFISGCGGFDGCGVGESIKKVQSQIHEGTSSTVPMHWAKKSEE